MACLRSLHCDRRKNGYCYRPDPHLVCVCFLSDDGLSADHLFRARFLDEHEAIYPFRKKKSTALPVVHGLTVHG